MTSRPYRVATVPNLLSLMRLVLTPLIAYLIIVGSLGLASTFLCLCAVSDFLDGFIARRFKQESFIGACLDPIADKFFVIVSFYALSVSSFSTIFIPLWFIRFMLVKEFVLVVGILLFFLKLQKIIKIKPSLYGKSAAFIQMFSLYIIVICSYLRSYTPIFGSYFFMGLAFVVSIALLDYCRVAVSIYKEAV